MVELNLKPFKRLIKFIYLKLLRLNDTPQRISLGLALGVFLGFIPGSGPIAAITLAVIFRLNRFAALMGSLVTNTWISIVMLIPAIKVGAIILNLRWVDVYNNWVIFLQHFQWSTLFKLSIYKIILPVFVGYVTIGLILAILVYVVSISVLINKKYGIKDRSNLP